MEPKSDITERIWLNYFNRVLFEQGVITESERNRMAQKIESRKPSTHAKKSIAL